MANIDNVQLPDGSSYNIVDNTSGFATQNYVDSAVSSVTKTTIGLGNVDNTSDLNKPISTATQTALDTLDEDKADKADIAPVESSSTASQTYQIGDQFYYNGLLYKATAVINSGGTITPNGNCVLSDSVTEQIKAITDNCLRVAQIVVSGNQLTIPLSLINNYVEIRAKIKVSRSDADYMMELSGSAHYSNGVVSNSLLGCTVYNFSTGAWSFTYLSPTISGGNIVISLSTSSFNGYPINVYTK